MSTALWVLDLTVLALAPFWFWRCTAVSRYRTRLVNKISVAVGFDVILGHPFPGWRYRALDRVTYMQMVFRFWRPLDSFYPDLSFTDPAAPGPRAGVHR